MHILKTILTSLSLLFIFSCSESYKKLSNGTFSAPNEFSQHLFEAYKHKADFEAKEMHDWNSAKLYAEKALKASRGNNVYPQKISYWKLSKEEEKLKMGYVNLLNVYEDAVYTDPFNLAKAISSLDCWSEQQKEGWQTWDINKCRNDFLNAMHAIYETLIKKNNGNTNIDNKTEVEITKSNDSAAIVAEDLQQNILQIVYFDFNKSNLSEVSLEKIKKFIGSKNNSIKKFIIVGHTDSAGTKEYNMTLSLKRAKTVRDILLKLAIKKENIKILGKGENDLKIKTADDIAHPANRRAEISPLN
jgi:OOP family OmpA-OmpF porin